MPGLAIMTADPGGKTGVAWGFLNAEADTVGAALRRARRKGSLGGAELQGSPESQARWIAERWVDFHYRAISELGCRSEDVDLVLEAFDLRQRNVDLAPVKVTHALLSLLQKPGVDPPSVSQKTDESFSFIRTGTALWPFGQPIFQKPDQAMTFATNKRLREWDAWVVGSEHIRDAMRHLAARANAVLL
jgi:hypothetical protein